MGLRPFQRVYTYMYPCSLYQAQTQAQAPAEVKVEVETETPRELGSSLGEERVQVHNRHKRHYHNHH